MNNATPRPSTPQPVWETLINDRSGIRFGPGPTNFLGCENDQQARLIVKAVNAYDSLSAENMRLRAENTRLRAALQAVLGALRDQSRSGHVTRGPLAVAYEQGKAALRGEDRRDIHEHT